MKTIILKQKYDCYGPWKSFDYKDETPLSVLKSFGAKAGFPFEFITQMKADFRIVNYKATKLPEWIRTAMAVNMYYKPCIDKYMEGIYEPEDIDLSEYDIVYVQDAFVKQKLSKQLPDSLVVTTVAEHGEFNKVDEETYDLLLDHTLDGRVNVVDLPERVSFPLMRDKQTVNTLFNNEKENKVYLDYRTISMLSVNKQNIAWTKYDASEFISSFTKKLDEIGFELSHNAQATSRAWMVEYPPNYDDPYNYNEKLSKAKYAVMATKGAIGQSIVDAAVHNCICIGDVDGKYHNMICHPNCLIDGPNEETILDLISVIDKDLDLQKEILEYQNNQIENEFTIRPRLLLERALELKRNGTTT